MKLLSSSLLLAAASGTVVSALGPAAPGQPPRPPGKPAKIEAWKWTNPFAAGTAEDSGPSKFVAACEATATFQATEYMLDDLSDAPPRGLIPWREGLKKVFSNREYPGAWDGIDPHGYDRTLLMMEWTAVPAKVRAWIAGQEAEEEAYTGEQDELPEEKKGKGLFAVYRKPDLAKGEKIEDTVFAEEEEEEKQAAAEGEGEKKKEKAKDENLVVIFAPGALYEVLPLWVAEGSDCVGES